MNFYTFKINDQKNGYHYYIISHINDLDLNLDIAESYASAFSELPINSYFNICVGWDDVDVEKCDNISPIQVINKALPADAKNMNISDEYKKVLGEAIEQLKNNKKPRAKKVKDPNEIKEPKAKKEPKARGKKAVNTKVNIGVPEGPVIFN